MPPRVRSVRARGLTLAQPDLRSRFRGCLLGGAVGDALGAPVEFMRLDEIRHLYGPGGIALEGFRKKSQKTPPEMIGLAERRLADWRRRGRARKTKE